MIHGWFKTTPHELHYGSGCRKCGYILAAEKHSTKRRVTLRNKEG